MKPLLILLTPITHSKPIRAMIPCGASAGTDTGGDGGASATTTKPGDPMSSPSAWAIVEAVSVHIDHDIVLTGREWGVPDEHWTSFAVPTEPRKSNP